LLLYFHEKRKPERSRRDLPGAPLPIESTDPTVVGHLLNGVTEPVLERAFQYWKNVDQTLGEHVEKGVRDGRS